jgi:hypothetical protein
VTHIFVTHTHRDHSPAVPAIRHATGATVYAEGIHRAARPLHIGEHNPLDSSGDRDFVPDVYLKDGEIATVTAGCPPSGGHRRMGPPHRWGVQNSLQAGMGNRAPWRTIVVREGEGVCKRYAMTGHIRA